MVFFEVKDTYHSSGSIVDRGNGRGLVSTCLRGLPKMMAFAPQQTHVYRKGSVLLVLGGPGQ